MGIERKRKFNLSEDSEPENQTPDIFHYHDYRSFLKDWFQHLRETKPGFSLRSLSRDAKMAVGNLSMILSGSRSFKPKSLAKILPHIFLSATERSYLGLLCQLSDSHSQDERAKALSRIHRFRSYRQLNPKELEVYKYLSHWYFVAIREMAQLPGFRAEAKWIQGRLREKVSIAEINQALSFLKENDFIKVSSDLSAKVQEKDIQCMAGVYRMSIGKFHREMFEKAANSLDTTKRNKRKVLAHVMAVSPDKYAQVCEIYDEMVAKIAALQDVDHPSSQVYHFGLTAFPLTKGGEEEDKE